MTTKRSFRVDTSSLSTEIPLLDDGMYAGVITAAGCLSKAGKPTLRVQEEMEWPVRGQPGVKTGRWIISGSFMYTVTLTSKRAIKKLQRDEPKFVAFINLAFDPEKHTLNDNHILGAWLKTLGLHEVNFDEQVDWEFDENITVPDELANVPEIVTMLNSITYHTALLTAMGNAAAQLPVKTQIVKAPSRQNKEVLENSINTARFCGIIEAEEGAENDLED